MTMPKIWPSFYSIARRTYVGHALAKVALFIAIVSAGVAQSAKLERLKYNHPGLVVDLGVGLWAWPLPMDFDGDGDLDLVVNCPDKPYNGVYFFENVHGAEQDAGVQAGTAHQQGTAKRSSQLCGRPTARFVSSQ
jgi:hypothetical protein